MRTKTLIPLISFLVLLLLFDVSCGMEEDNNNGMSKTHITANTKKRKRVDHEDNPFEMKREDWEEYLRDIKFKVQRKKIVVDRETRPYPNNYRPEVKGHSVAKRTLWKKFVSNWLTIKSKENNVVIMEPFGGMGVHIDVPDGYDNKDMSKLIIESGSIVAAYEAACNTRRKKKPVKFYIGEKTDRQKNFVNMLMYYVRSKAREYCSTDPSSITVKSADFTHTIRFVKEVLKTYDGHHALMMVDPYSMRTAPMDNLVAFFITGGTNLRTLVTNFFPGDVFKELETFSEVPPPGQDASRSAIAYLNYRKARADFSKFIEKVMGYDNLDDFFKMALFMYGADEDEDDHVLSTGAEAFRGENLLRKLWTDIKNKKSRDDGAKLARVLANIHRKRLIDLTLQWSRTTLFTDKPPFDVAFVEYNRKKPMYITYCLTTISDDGYDACDHFDNAVEELMVRDDDDTGTFRISRRSGGAPYEDGRRYAYFRDNGKDSRVTKSAVSDDDDILRLKERRDEDNGRVLLP